MILITGSTGTIGRELLARMARAGVPVRAMTRNPEGAVAAARAQGLDADPAIEWASGDLAAPATLARALDGVERAFLLSTAEPRQAELQGNFIAAARAAGVRHVVKVSALGAGADALFPSGRLHAETERQLEASGLAFTHLRPHFFMQNLLKGAASIRAEDKLFAPMADARISLMDARDVAAVAAAVLLEGSRHEGQSYELTGPEALSFADLAAHLSEATGRPITYVAVSPEAAQKVLQQRSMPPWLIDTILGLYASFRTGRFAEVSPAVPTLTGGAARSFLDFVREHVDGFAPQPTPGAAPSRQTQSVGEPRA
jgi:uncharacterized protein YbjT (DUF2867 family)